MSDDKDYFIFMRELARLQREYSRCSDIGIREEITKDLNLLTEAIELLLHSKNATKSELSYIANPPNF